MAYLLYFYLTLYTSPIGGQEKEILSWYLVQFLSTRLKSGSFFFEITFFLHFSSSNVVQSVWRAQGSIWRCSNRESFLIDKLFSIGPWYDFIEECERAENSTTRDFERNCCHFPFYGSSFLIYIGDRRRPIRWACLKCIHEFDFFKLNLFWQLANYTRAQESDTFLEQNIYFSLSKTHSWGWFWIGVSFYWQALFTGDRGSIMREAGTRPWIYLAKYSPSVRKHRHSGQILLYSCHSRLPLAAYFAIKRNTNIMLILMLMWMLYVSN